MLFFLFQLLSIQIEPKLYWTIKYVHLGLISIGICYYANVVKEENENANIDHSQKIYGNAYFPTSKT